MANTRSQPRKKSVRQILFAKMPEVEAIFRKYKVVLAYLFGSQAKERTTVLSDIDIAVLFDKQVPKQEYSDRQVTLITEFMDIFSRNDVDVVVLNTAPPLISHSASKGYLFYKKLEKERVKFESNARKEYLDTQRIRDVQNKALQKRYIKKSSQKGTYNG